MTILGGDGSDEIDDIGLSLDHIGGDASDTLWGAAGSDTLIGGAGRDFLFGQAGADVLLARDGERDTLNGGADDDRAVVDFSPVKDVLTEIEHAA